MKTHQLAAALLAAVTVMSAAPAFASGYGPAPFYQPSVGAPASQRGQSVQTVNAERESSADAQQAYGGVIAGGTQSGGRTAVAIQGELYAHH